MQLKKPDPSKKVILNTPVTINLKQFYLTVLISFQNPEQEYLTKKSQWMQIESIRNKTAKDISKKPNANSSNKNIIQKKPVNPPQGFAKQKASHSNDMEEEKEFGKPQHANKNSIQKPPVSSQPQKQTLGFSREEAIKPLIQPKQAKPIQISSLSSISNKQESAHSSIAKDTNPPKGLPKSNAAPNKFNPEKFVEIPIALLVDMNKTGKTPLFKLGDTILYKCEELDRTTFSPTVSGYKIAKILEIRGDRINLRVIASEPASHTNEGNGFEKEKGEVSEEEEEEDTNPALQLHNFLEFHIDIASLNKQRLELIKTSQIEFKEGLQNGAVHQVQENISISKEPTKLATHPDVDLIRATAEQDYKLVALKRIGKQVY